MDSLDLFYKAYSKYRDLTVTDTETTRFMRVSQGQSSETHEGMKVIFTSCTIDEEWVLAIENGLPFIEKAIKEERKFIRTEGDVLPIEKVRKTSVSSIQDLAKHSNYITHEGMEDGPTDIMPDKLLVVTKENDFAVYENKVVYACLVYLKDFVSSRLTKIKNETNKYEGLTFVNKKLDVGNRKVDFNFTLNEKRFNDPYVTKLNSSGEIIARLDKIIALVMAYLKTPLMNEVAKADMVSRPITKTNVLRMDRNFRETLSLFDYIAAYHGEGFTLQTTERNLYPFSDELECDTCQIMLLASFLNYMYGNSLSGDLKKRYQALEAEEKKREEEKLLARLSSIHSKANMEGKTINDYLLAFEEGYRILEDRLEQREEDIKKLEEAHKEEIHNLEINHENEIREIEATHQEEVTSMQTDFDNRIQLLNDQHTQEITNLNLSHEEQISSIQQGFAKEIEDLKVNYEDKIASLISDHENQVNSLTDQYNNEKQSLIDDYTRQINELLEKLKNKTLEAEDFENKFHTANGIVRATKLGSGRKEDFPDITSEDDFNMLEKDFIAFSEYFENTWNDVKENITKTIMSQKAEKRRLKRKSKSEDVKKGEN